MVGFALYPLREESGMKFTIALEVCQFCADEFRGQWDIDHEGEDTRDTNKEYWDAYHSKIAALARPCVVTGDFFDDFEPVLIEEFMCEKHLREAADALVSK